MAPHWLFLAPRQLLRPINEIHLFIFHEEKVFLLGTLDQPPKWRVPSIAIDENAQQTPIYELVLRRMVDAVHKRAFNGVPLQHYFADQQDIDKSVTTTSDLQRILSIKLFLNDRSFNVREKDSAGEEVFLDAAASICYSKNPNRRHLPRKWVALGEESRFESPLSSQHLARMFYQQNILQQMPATQLFVNTIKVCIKVKEIEDGGDVSAIKHALIATKGDASHPSLVLMEGPEESWMALGFHKHNIIEQQYAKPKSSEFGTAECKVKGRYCPIWGHPEPTFLVEEATLRGLVDTRAHTHVEWEPWTSKTELATAKD